MITPLIHIRSYSTDQYFLDKVFYSNFYRLKKIDREGQQRNHAVAVDVGAHCGYFALTAVSAGYTKCYTFEPFSDNFKMLLKNVEVFSGLVVTYNIGIASNQSFMALRKPVANETQFIDYGVIQRQTSTLTQEDEVASAESLTNVLQGYISQESVINLLKINTGYAFDFVSGNEVALGKVENICFEMPYSAKELSYVKNKLTELGFKDSLVIELSQKEQNFGFLGFFSKNSIEDVFDVSDLKSKNYENTDQR